MSSIVSQRLAVAASCVAFWFLASGWPMPRGLQWALFAMLTVLACIEKLASVMSLVSVEKDWVSFAQFLILQAILTYHRSW
jgi:iron-regulated transporter 1